MRDTVDLGNIRKIVNQRATRLEENSIDTEHISLAKIASDAMKKVRDNPSVENAQNFADKEKDYLDYWATKPNVISYSDQVFHAITMGNYTVTKTPYNIAEVNNSDPEAGFIYIASSPHHPNEVKIGYTTIDIYKRMRGISKRYGYPINLEAWALIQYPVRVEKAVHEKAKTLRVSGCTSGESNEWFYGKTLLYTNLIDIISDEMSLVIAQKSKSWS